MMDKTELLDLPNELFSYIFQYFKSADLVQTFSQIPSIRLQSLLQPHLRHLDLGDESDQWIDAYLPALLSQCTSIRTLRLQDKHFHCISDCFSSTEIQSMHIVSSDWTTDALKEALDRLRGDLKQLTVTFTCPHGKGDLAGHLFQSDSQIEQLNVTGRFLYFDGNDIHICERLTSLSIELEGIHRLFILLEHLPRLHELKVKLRNEDRMVQPSTSVERIASSNVLHRVTFTGCTKHFDHLENFFSAYGSSIEHLSINIDLMYYIVDGKRLERDVLIKMPRLSTVDLLIHSAATFCDPLKIETFQSAIWEKFNPVVYCYDRQAHEHTLFTLPYRCDRFQHLSNNCVSSWTANRSVSLCFARVRVLSVIPSTPLKSETVQFIQRNFPNIKTLEWTQPIKFPEIEQEDDPNRMLCYMADDLLCNSTIQFPSITKFSFLSSSQLDNYPVFRRFLRLLPNLVSLQMYIGRCLYRQIQSDEDQSISKALTRIRLLQMVRFYDEKSVLTNEEIQSLFPNAKILFDYDEM